MEANGPIRMVSAIRVHGQVQSRRHVATALEEPLTIVLNGQQVALLMRLPGQEKELATGFCLSEGMIRRFEDIHIVHHCGQAGPQMDPGGETALESRNRVEIQCAPDAIKPEVQLGMVRLIRSGCGTIDGDFSVLELPSLPEGPHVPAEVILTLSTKMRKAQRLYKSVGGVHAAALFSPDGNLVTAAEDVGRHNALDKVLGHCLLRGIPLQDKIALSSGRLSSEMVTKALRVGLPILASTSAPTSLAVELALQFNLTVLGYIHGRRFTVYAHPERLCLEP